MSEVKTRLAQYLRYHATSMRIGDVDPSNQMLRYVCDRFELSLEQRYWLAWLYSMFYCGASGFFAYNEFPDFENVDVGRMSRWWWSHGRQQIVAQTDRRWVRSSNQFVPGFESYRRWVGDGSQHEHFSRFGALSTPEARYDALYDGAKQLFSFGQFALFLYLESLHVVTPLDLCPTDLDLDKAWSCRNGLYYAFGLDQLIEDRETRIAPGCHAPTDEKWRQLRAVLEPTVRLPSGVPERVWPTEIDVDTCLELHQKLSATSQSTVWNTETMLCAFRKYYRGKRYVGYYLDRQAIEISKLQDHVQSGVDWQVLWDYRAETYDHAWLAEMHDGVTERGLTRDWKDYQELRTWRIVEGREP